MASRAQALPSRTGRQSGTRKKAAKSNAGRSYLVWLPIVAGIAAAYFTVRYAEVVPLLGPSGLFRLRLIAPLAMLAHQPQLSLPDSTADGIAQALMYIQFPLYGLLLGLVWRMAGLLRALLTVALVHILAVAAVMILAQL